jgi:hypothetical protein
MQLSHPLGNLPAGLRHPQILGRQWPSLEVFLETAVVERAQYARSNVLAPQTTENLQLFFTIDQVIDLRTIDAQQKFSEERQTDRSGSRRYV